MKAPWEQATRKEGAFGKTPQFIHDIKAWVCKKEGEQRSNTSEQHPRSVAGNGTSSLSHAAAANAVWRLREDTRGISSGMELPCNSTRRASTA